MNEQITKHDVARYFRNELDRPRRREIEQACRTDLQVREWFNEMMPSDEEVDSQPLPGEQLEIGECGKLAGTTYHSVERVERAREWSEWIRRVAAGGNPANPPSGEVIPAELLEGDSGTLLYREAVPLHVGAASDSFSVPPVAVPCIAPDFTSRRLLIRQMIEQVPSGVVTVRAVRKVGESQYDPLPPVSVELERTQPPHSEAYWCADVDLDLLIRDFRPGDDFIYCVEAAPQG